MHTVTALLVVGSLAFAQGTAYKCSNRENTDQLRDLYLNFHNDARRRVAKGKEPNKNGYLNPAKNMYKLSWNCDMEKKAQDHIRSCSSSLGNFGSYGQNMMSFGGSGFPKPEQQIRQALNSWWNRVKQVGMTGNENRYTNQALFTFSNMVLAKTTEIGCAHKVCNNNRMTVFCLYNEIGYFTNEILWETGRACSKPADCTTYKSTKCEDGLCVKAFEKPDNGASNQCSGADGMTDSVRNKFLNMNNEYRSLVAKGKAEDKLGGFAPKAAKMPKMKYECALEALAMKHAKRCRYEHSPDYTRPGIGENIFQVSIPNFDKTRAAQMASELWFGELKKFGVGKENKFTAKIRNRPKMPIGHYTQMVWDTTRTLGCAVVGCPSAGMTFAVCNYKPAGNYRDRLIYEKGAPCSKCPQGSRCEQGLCVY
ncbi:hypothetical protein Y032_0004g2023 [Ancylostoma ceylanicum]|uniref:SCP domain-containing protein n=1 Tax=Ancylostoma ceylanicum TaxID=53326 RepID=A0A016VV59_9BILA|nr:hypothetical protein Y032_0004g2023 [Ancylostoma ceylanicum]